MIKIEKVLDGAYVTMLINGVDTQIFPGAMLTREEAETIKVVGGTLIYSIDDRELVEVIGIPKVAGKEPSKEIKEIVEISEEISQRVVDNGRLKS